MSRVGNLPHEARVRKALDELLLQAEETGTTPSVLALARRFGLSNTTFRRHYPDIARQVSDVRRVAPSESPARSGAARYDTLVARNALLRRANRSLSDHVKIAAANIQRLTLENAQLRHELHAAAKVSSIVDRNQPSKT